MAEAPVRPNMSMTRRQAFGAVGAAVAAAGLAEEALAADTPLRAPLPAPEGPTRLYPHQSATRATRDISGMWRFRLDPKDEGEAALVRRIDRDPRDPGAVQLERPVRRRA